MIRVYIDQNVFSHINTEFGENWKQHPLANTILVTHMGQVACWASPTHIIELTQWSDSKQRQQLARVILGMIGSTRMWAGADYFLVEHFGEFLNSIIPDVFNPDIFLTPQRETAERLWLGYLGLLAASDELVLGTGVGDVELMKLQVELIHNLICSDPDTYIDKIVSCASSHATTQDPDPLKIQELSGEEIHKRISDLQAMLMVPSQKSLEKLKKHRREIAAVYGACDISIVLEAIFHFPCALEFSFDIRKIVKNWNQIREATGCNSLPKHIATASDRDLLTNRSYVIETLQSCIDAAAHAELPVATIGYYTLLREIEVALNKKVPPKPSVALDMDHASACLAFDLFVCHDKKLRDNVRAFVKNNSATCKTVACCADEVEREIKRLTSE